MLKRSVQKVHDVEFPDYKGQRHDITCDICGRFCLGKSGKVSHIQSLHTRALTNHEILLNIICHIHGKVCKEVGKRKIYTNFHKNIPNEDKMYVSHVCQIHTSGF